MTKKQREISNEEMMELIGLRPTSKSEDEDSDKRAIDLAIEEFSRNESTSSVAETSETAEEEAALNNTVATPKIDVPEQQPSASSIQRRVSSKQRRMSLEEYRNTFLQVPKIDDRKPVFVSCEVRDKLDEFVRKLGGRKMSVSGLIENIARQHLEIYSEDFEQWRKL